MTVRIVTGDCRTVLGHFEPESFACCVTSPPYFGLRDYGHDQQIGLEETPEAYVQQLVEVFREVRRVLRDDGVLWVNIGDSYAGSWGAQGRNPPRADHAGKQSGGPTRPYNAIAARQIAAAPVSTTALRGIGVKPKDLYGIPWMLAFALRADGWYLRDEIVWAKPNAMPESVRDRCTKAHEKVFQFTKSRDYFFDPEAIAEPASDAPESVARRRRGGGKPVGTPALFGQPGGQSGARSIAAAGCGTRNRRNVWTIPTTASSVAHFATMAPELAAVAIQAATSAHGCCPACGARWVRVTRPLFDLGHTGSSATAYGEGSTAGRLALLRQAAREQGTEYTGGRRTIGWRPDCVCNFPAPLPPVPDVVLDPFGGAGTTALVADRLHLDSVLIELNPDYAAIARGRVHGDAPLFAEVAA